MNSQSHSQCRSNTYSEQKKIGGANPGFFEICRYSRVPNTSVVLNILMFGQFSQNTHVLTARRDVGTGGYGGQMGLLFFVGALGRQLSQISHRKLKISISHDVVILSSEPDALLRRKISRNVQKCPEMFANV